MSMRDDDAHVCMLYMYMYGHMGMYGHVHV